MLPPLAPRTPEQRVEARLRRVVHTPRGASRGGGVLLRTELAAQNEGLARENEVLRTQLAQSEEKRRECEAQLAELRAQRESGEEQALNEGATETKACLLYTSPSPRDKRQSRMPSSA